MIKDERRLLEKITENDVKFIERFENELRNNIPDIYTCITSKHYSFVVNIFNKPITIGWFYYKKPKLIYAVYAVQKNGKIYSAHFSDYSDAFFQRALDFAIEYYNKVKCHN